MHFLKYSLKFQDLNNHNLNRKIVYANMNFYPSAQYSTYIPLAYAHLPPPPHGNCFALRFVPLGVITPCSDLSGWRSADPAADFPGEQPAGQRDELSERSHGSRPHRRRRGGGEQRRQH